MQKHLYYSARVGYPFDACPVFRETEERVFILDMNDLRRIIVEHRSSFRFGH